MNRTPYLEGKRKVMEGLKKGLFYQKEDGSVWADSLKDGLDQKLLIRPTARVSI